MRRVLSSRILVLLCVTALCVTGWSQTLTGAFTFTRGTLVNNTTVGGGAATLVVRNMAGANVTFTTTFICNAAGSVYPVGSTVLVIQATSAPLNYAFTTRTIWADQPSEPGSARSVPIDAQGKLLNNVAFISNYGLPRARFHTQAVTLTGLSLPNGLSIGLGPVPTNYSLPIPLVGGTSEGSSNFVGTEPGPWASQMYFWSPTRILQGTGAGWVGAQRIGIQSGTAANTGTRFTAAEIRFGNDYFTIFGG